MFACRVFASESAAFGFGRCDSPNANIHFFLSCVCEAGIGLSLNKIMDCRSRSTSSCKTWTQIVKTSLEKKAEERLSQSNRAAGTVLEVFRLSHSRECHLEICREIFGSARSF